MIVLAGRAIEPNTGHAAGRALLAELYRAHTGRELPAVLVTDRGKPYFEGDPIRFSISHTKRHVFVALSEKPIGIDAEEADREVNLRLAEKILSPAEQQRYAAAADKRAALLKLWVLKEAWVKLTGEGLRGYPNHTDFSPDDPRIIEKDGCYLLLHRIKKENDAANYKANPIRPECTFDDFMKLDLRVGTVLECTKVPKADKLLQFKIDDGLETRTILSGIAKHFNPDELVGKQVCFIANLPPRTLRGIVSEGMILSAEDSEGKLSLLTVTPAAKPGSEIK